MSVVSSRAAVGVLPLDVYFERPVAVDTQSEVLDYLRRSGDLSSQFDRYLDLITRLELGMTDEEAVTMLGLKRHVVPARRADVMHKFPGLIFSDGVRGGCQVWKATTISKFQPLEDRFP